MISMIQQEKNLALIFSYNSPSPET